jgi:hypothetical protein
VNPVVKLNCVLAYLLMSDNANLLDITESGKPGRLSRYFLE